MNILNIEHISKTYGEKKIFDDISWGIQEGEKIGVIGINGMGKSSLLRVLAGEEEPDAGQITMRGGTRLRYLPQQPRFPAGATALSYVLGQSTGADPALLSQARRMLNRLGITDQEAPLEQLSGGMQKRAALAKALLEPCDLLLLDEPTNHLDHEMTEWLEDYLRKYKGVLIMVTHDRYFLDRVTNYILELDRGKLYGYEGNYSRVLTLKAEREEMELASERKRKSILRMELEWAKRGCRARSTKQRARLDRLEDLKNHKGPEETRTVEMDPLGSRMGKKTIELKHVTKALGGKQLIDDFSYIALKNQRIGIVGENGCGKTTLMKLMAGELEPDSGTIERGETIRIGYFAQTSEHMDPAQRVIDHIRDIAEYIPTREGVISASSLLENFLFDANLQYAPIGKLSGGERRRLYLLSVLASGCNVLLLDEPTNDLDIPTLTILEDYLQSFSGIVIAVSHDRYFLDTVCDKIFSFEGDGLIRQYEGGYSDYEEKRKWEAAQGAGNAAREPKTQGAGKAQGKEGTPSSGKSWKKDMPQKLKFTYQEQREYETIDEEIAGLEERAAQLDREMAENATNSAKLSELLSQKEETAQKLSEKMDRWVYLNDLAERIEAQKQAR